PDAELAGQEPAAAKALTIDGIRYGAPLTAKALVLFVSDALLAKAPPTMEELAAQTLPSGAFQLAYEEQQAFFHAPFMHAFGARMLDEKGRFAFFGPAAARSVEFVRSLAQSHAMPDEPSGALVKQLFVTRKVAAVISGPWLAGELREEAKDLAYHVEPLPRIAGAPEPMRSYVTIEAICATPYASGEAKAFARWFAGPEAATIRARKGRQAVTALLAWDDPRVRGDGELASFREAARTGVVTPASAAMRAAWVPANQAILKALRG